MKKDIKDYLHFHFGEDAQARLNKFIVGVGGIETMRSFHKKLKNYLMKDKPMKKEIKDYLHLYLGCEVIWLAVPDAVGILVGISNSEVEPDRTVAIIGGAVFQEWYTEEVKPILRPLSDACMQEKADAKKLILLDKWGQQTVESMAEVTRYLLSKHFDLFGLIESGLAIDKTKLAKPQPKDLGPRNPPKVKNPDGSDHIQCA